MSAPIESVQPGQRWRRKSDGVLTKVIYVDSPFQFRRSVHHQAQRRTITEYGSFLKKYEIVADAAPTGTSTQDEDAQAQQEKNTTREGILVRGGQIWEYLDTRQGKRRVVIESVADGRPKSGITTARSTPPSASPECTGTPRASASSSPVS
ncbi:hypothetical protein [Streptomyces sp. NPDC003032]